MMGAQEFADLGFLDLKKLFSCPPLMTTHDIGRCPPHNFSINLKNKFAIPSKYAVLM
jgi:hypothetical protein